MKKYTVRMLALGLITLASIGRANGAADETDLLRHATQATIRIFSGAVTAQGDFRGQCSGTGFIISPRGLVLTTLQAVSDADGRIYPALWAGLVNSEDGRLVANRALRLKTIASNRALNLALLQLAPAQGRQARFPFIKLAGADEITYGSPVTLIGSAAGGGLQLGRLRTVVVEIDERNGGVVVDGSLGDLARGGPVVNERGELLGIQTTTQNHRQITFFGDDDYPVGSINAAQVGVYRPLSTVARFLRDHSAEGGETGFPGLPVVVQVGRTVKDKRSGQPVPGAVIGIVSRRALVNDDYISPNELIGYGRSDFQGSFEINRPMRANRYLLKVVHPRYKVLLLELDIDANARELAIELIRN